MTQKNNMWHKIGFQEDPFDTKPLNVNESHVHLLMGRESEQIDFLTAIESSNEGIFVLSGVPGVGKTSFLNVQQYLVEINQGYGDSILAARTLCSIQPSDEPINIAIRCLQSYTNSIKEYCDSLNKKLPKQVQNTIDWLHQNKPATFQFGFSILGNGVNYGKEVHLPSLKDATFETLHELLKTLSLEVTAELAFSSSFIVLDNIENLHEEDLSDCLITFRDTLFTIPNIWWILIGQSGLSSLIQSTNPKVFQRLSNSLELKPITVENLIKAVNIRVEKFHTSDKGSSPISEKIYLKLFECSNGEIRFVFKYCSQICVAFVQAIRKLMVSRKIPIDDSSFNKVMGQHITKKHIEDDFALLCLKKIISNEFEGLYLSNNEKAVLKKIGELNKVRPKDFKEFKGCGVKSLQQFTTIFLTKLNEQNLLLRKQEGRAVTYELRGIASLALEYDLLEEQS